MYWLLNMFALYCASAALTNELFGSWVMGINIATIIINIIFLYTTWRRDL